MVLGLILSRALYYVMAFLQLIMVYLAVNLYASTLAVLPSLFGLCWLGPLSTVCIQFGS